jgi:thiol-disulfide isomerase/thioredoxin
MNAPGGWSKLRMRLWIAVATLMLAAAVGVTAALLLRSVGEPEAPAPLAPALGDLAEFVTFPEPRPLPDATFADGEGRLLRLMDFRGRVVLLNLWATWCGPCREEMPTLDRLQAEHGSPDFEVVALSLDRGPVSTVRAFFAEHGIAHLTLYIDQTGQAAETLGITGLPATILIGRDGLALGSMLGAADWASPAAVDLIRRALAGDPPPEAAGSTFSNASRAAGEAEAGADEPM